MRIFKRKLIDKISTYRIQIFISVSVIVLLLLLLIQFSWIRRARSLNEEQFNHRVGLALHESVDEFTKDLQSCQKMKEYMSKSKYDAHDSALLKSEVEHLDSIIKEQFKNYQIQSPYTIEVLSTEDEQPKSKCFYFSLRKALSHDKAILNVYFKKREKNLMDSMGSMFICSIILILILCVLLGITIFSLIRDRKILSRTTDLINNIAHEFKTPMATIALASKMLGREKVSANKDKVNHYSNIISSENNRLGVQIDQLLKLSNIERGDLKLNFNSFHLHDLLEDCCESLSMQVAEREGSLKFNKFASQELIYGDRDLLQNVFCNLLDNAVKYSPNTPQIELMSKNINGSLLVSISDHGIGMTNEVQKHIFDRYYRASTGDRHDVKGFGIGLSYSKMIIKAHNGSIKVNSKKNMGSTFTVELPIV
ncbi:sensor histidine kinase [Ancylomarina longa]|uniref:histidine kinase n=1 Tax=Ancylomarina longa TaxID=2487017 RepID=A0A434AZY7_9BACT|nr:HAMP domain-containing sensor histidine kinase [Ancylomarina longa]RUT80075.1 sensor histidine kinase [Ancylomarina longa]